MRNDVRYPLGIQTFSEIIERGYLYVDKTEYIHRMTSLGKYIFLSRPRRFGKSLLTSTLKSYFEGRKELFKGLAIEKLETEWVKYPVLHFDLSGGKHLGKDALIRYLIDILDDNAHNLGIDARSEDVNIYFKNLIIKAREKYGQNVVILIDEYDAPLLDVIHKDDNLEELRQVMQNFYSPIKKCDQYIRFVFITGITKFSQLSIFSELNNLKNISMMKNFAGICGITEREMLSRMNEGIEAMANEQNWSKEECITNLKANYDGYHFAWPSEDVYNPFSLLNAMADRELNSYWFGSGTPTYLVNMLRKFNVSPSQLGRPIQAKASSFDAPTQDMISLTPLLYQSGYITIKDYDRISELYTLDIPNREIRIGLMESLLPNYLGQQAEGANTIAAKMRVALLDDDIDGMLNLLKTFLGTIPYVDNVGKPENFEAHWQQMLYTVFSLLGAKADVEVRTPKGRVDMVAQTGRNLYLFELKLDENAAAAMTQIDLKDYSKRFALCGLPVVKVGINFSVKERNITDWIVS